MQFLTYKNAIFILENFFHILKIGLVNNFFNDPKAIAITYKIIAIFYYIAKQIKMKYSNNEKLIIKN